MKSFLLLVLPFVLVGPYSANSQGICNPSGNVILFSNYDGGTLNINIDDNVPNIKIALCSYEPLTVNISGTYTSNVVEVLWAGYTIEGSSINGVDAGIVSLLQFPPATMEDPDGYPFIICAYECDLDFETGGCNTVDQATDYFLSTLNGQLRFSNFQYGSWSGTYNMSAGGNCCVGVECSIDVTASEDQTVCEGDTILLAASGGDSYEWFNDGDIVPCAFPCDEIEIIASLDAEFLVNGTNTEGCFGTDEISISVNPSPDVDLVLTLITLYVYGGSNYSWYLNGVLIEGIGGGVYTPEFPGTYSVFATDENGCSSWSNEVEVLFDQIDSNQGTSFNIYPNPSKGEFNIIGMPDGELHLAIFNGVGQKVMCLPNMTARIVQCEELENGIYKVELEQNGKFYLQSIVISK
ncbi:MAG: T9SS type A sorting domain-containing protein [Flavobacteriales bacterium]|nr:T9SS type A sorting domain-containing protein [Flavobacteriales bacterium]